MQVRFTAAVPAAGVGSRFGSALPKQYHEICGRPLIDHTLARLLSCTALEQVHVGVAAADAKAALIGKTLGAGERARVCVHRCGGASRAATVLALASLPAVAQSWLVVHDAVRPCVAGADVEAVLAKAAATGEATILAAPLAATLKEVAGERIGATVAREGLWLAQTPQVAPAEQLVEALEAATDPTDEAQALELAGAPVAVVPARHPNPKVTTAADLQLATALLSLK